MPSSASFSLPELHRILLDRWSLGPEPEPAAEDASMEVKEDARRRIARWRRAEVSTRVTTAGLAKRFEVDPKTIQKGFRDLKALGLPLHQPTKSGADSWCYDDSVTTTSSLDGLASLVGGIPLGEREAFAFQLATRLVGGLLSGTPEGYRQFLSRAPLVQRKEVFPILSELIQIRDQDVDDFRSPTLGSVSPADERIVRTFRKAMRDRRRLKIEYFSPSAADHDEANPEGVAQAFQFEPRLMTWKLGAFYVLGWHVDDRSPRTLQLARVRSARVAGSFRHLSWAGQPQEDLDAMGTWLTEPEAHTARIRMAPRQRHYAAERVWHPLQKWDPVTSILSVPYRSAEEMARTVLGWGEGMVVEGPPSLRRAVRDLLERKLRELA